MPALQKTPSRVLKDAGDDCFSELEQMLPEEQTDAKRNLSVYCKLDTLAMVWEKLRNDNGGLEDG